VYIHIYRGLFAIECNANNSVPFQHICLRLLRMCMYTYAVFLYVHSYMCIVIHKTYSCMYTYIVVSICMYTYVSCFIEHMYKYILLCLYIPKDIVQKPNLE